MRIKKLAAKNFRLFENLEIEFPDQNFICLIGNNGSGKSAVLDAISYLFNPKSNRTNNFSSDVNNKVKSDEFANLEVLYTYSEEHIFGVDIKDNTSEIKRYARLINTREKIQVGQIGASILYFNSKRTSIIENDINQSSNLFAWIISEVNAENQFKLNNNDLEFELDNLSNLRNAINTFFNNFENAKFGDLKVKTDVTEEKNFDFSDRRKSDIYINKFEEEIKLTQLSSGEKMMIFIVSEIARRLTIKSENKKEALNNEAVVLIDELDLHLHPNWQREIVGALKATFPNVQFFVTTHSPQILSSLKAEEIIEIDGDNVYSVSRNPFGRDSNGILKENMNDSERPKDLEKLIAEIFMNFAEDKTEEAIKLYEELKQKISLEDPILLRIESIIKRKEILNS